ncbi:MAG: hypothetical protein LBU57_00455 [Dysgonamonadaceae bacterium]|jgi:hypothetical protein|nr:hypothetical protein [Dysgonamonadaceae bacterium]
MKKILLRALFILISMNASTLCAQNTYPEDSIRRREPLPEFTVAVQPLVLINGGLRFDFEKRLHHPNHWLQLGITGYFLPQISSGENKTYIIGIEEEEIKGLKGAGINGGYKICLPSVSKSLYVMGSLSYTLSRVKYMEFGYHPFIEDGMKFYEYSAIMQTQTFNKIGANAIFGFQSSLEKKFLIDFYAGLGYVHSFYNASKAHFDESMFSYGYRGVTLVGGIRLGFAF